jgi:hypothetical protein
VRISNPAEPLWQEGDDAEPHLGFELEQVFGVDTEPAEAILGNRYQLHADVDAQGNLYVLDGQANRLVSFAPDGNVRWSAGRKGEGPGEFDDAAEIAVHPSGVLMLLNQERTRIDTWNTDGSYVSSLSLAESPLSLAGLTFPSIAGLPQPDDLVLYASMRGRTGSRVVRIDPTEPAVLADFEWNQLPEVEMPRNLASGADVRAERGIILMGSGAGYRFRIYAPDGTVLRQVTRAVDYPVRSGFYEEERARGMSSFGEVLAPMHLDPDYLLVPVWWAVGVEDPDAIAYAHGRAFRERRRPEPLDRLSSYDLYDREGRLLYSHVEEGEWPSTGEPLFIDADNLLYAIDDFPFPQIRRYAISVAR